MSVFGPDTYRYSKPDADGWITVTDGIGRTGKIKRGTRSPHHNPFGSTDAFRKVATWLIGGTLDRVVGIGGSCEVTKGEDGHFYHWRTRDKKYLAAQTALGVESGSPRDYADKHGIDLDALRAQEAASA